MKRLQKAGVVIAAAFLSITLSSQSAMAASYTIQPKDSLYKISVLFKTTVSTLKKNNNLKSNNIKPGQKLKLNAKTYTVKKGDTLNKIAKKHKITLANLKKANNKKSNLIKPGQKLLLPGIKTSAKTTTTASTMSLQSTAAQSKAATTSTSAATTSTSAAKTSASSNDVISYTSAELDLLARLITAEATGQPYNAMVGIGGVVVNRVQSKEWPDSISKVINHIAGGYYQFTPVKNGYIKKPASAISIKAAKAALKGSDPSNGAMFYFDDSSTNDWLWSKPITARYGAMVFVK
ncbi:peptidoglycan-binding protein [Anaerocolumna cellulosilytica]|uniref:Peptidoglycan-binding protein n=1 Tax=Anaerocolumna cellulosilytica TaxID=433286 RepID=A0A6S6RAL0_9FIRM|nr:LysM peptidoglycan-binding domain-containing protein [Anaerocolumna cellulosilytica]MBB5195436.1 spore germination cell wall hydrolase CwlJ-like protein [Anaerocolumna cellulosilytica]BCJ95968.1 peptidoglycan-binding protein [Anaerocolumna cellulosilytica]